MAISVRVFWVFRGLPPHHRRALTPRPLLRILRHRCRSPTQENAYGAIWHLFRSPAFWLVSGLAPVVALLPDLAFLSLSRWLYPSDVDIIQESDLRARQSYPGSKKALACCYPSGKADAPQRSEESSRGGGGGDGSRLGGGNEDAQQEREESAKPLKGSAGPPSVSAAYAVPSKVDSLRSLPSSPSAPSPGGVYSNNRPAGGGVGKSVLKQSSMNTGRVRGQAPTKEPSELGLLVPESPAKARLEPLSEIVRTRRALITTAPSAAALRSAL